MGVGGMRGTATPIKPHFQVPCRRFLYENRNIENIPRHFFRCPPPCPTAPCASRSPSTLKHLPCAHAPSSGQRKTFVPRCYASLPYVRPTLTPWPFRSCPPHIRSVGAYASPALSVRTPRVNREGMVREGEGRMWGNRPTSSP